MLALFITAILLLGAAAFALQFTLKLRVLKAEEAVDVAGLVADRYRPMLRLLSESDLAFVSANPQLKKRLRAERRELFRGYLRCLTRDYGRLLAGLRQAIVQSGTDRPDLARAIAKNRILFAVGICKIELRLLLHAGNLGTVDIEPLVTAVEVLRTQAGIFSATAPSMA